MKEIACVIANIDEEANVRRPIMDDYDAGIDEGLRLAREIARQELLRTVKEISSSRDNKWVDIYQDTEYTEFRYNGKSL